MIEFCHAQFVFITNSGDTREERGANRPGWHHDTLVKVKIIFAAEFTKNTAERIKWKCGEGASDDDD